MKQFDSLDEEDCMMIASSATDCTGLIPALPQSDAEKEAYEDLYPYMPPKNQQDK